MRGTLRSKREERIWSERVDGHVSKMVAEDRPLVEIDIYGTHATRRRLLDLYRDRFARSGYRQGDVDRGGESWTVTFHRSPT